MSEEHPVEVQQIRDRQSLPRVFPDDLVDRFAVAGELAFIPVAEAPRFSGRIKEGGDPRRVDDDPFDRAGCRDRLDASGLSERVEQLRQLVAVQGLTPAPEVQPSQPCADPPRLRPERPIQVHEAPHRLVLA